MLTTKIPLPTPPPTHKPTGLPPPFQLIPLFIHSQSPVVTSALHYRVKGLTLTCLLSLTMAGREERSCGVEAGVADFMHPADPVYFT